MSATFAVRSLDPAQQVFPFHCKRLTQACSSLFWFLSLSLSLFLCCVHVHTGVSGHTAHLMTQALEDASFVRRFLQKNQRNLRSSYNVLESKLKAAGIPFLPASAGMFCWIDMRKFLRER